MLSLWASVVAWFDAALAGMAHPAAIAVALALTTLLLEDLAIAAGVALAAQGLIGWPLSFAAVAGGIALGDLGLYGTGLLARRLPWLRRRTVGDRAEWARAQITGRLASAVMLARVIPGLRLVTYTACGLLRVPFGAFAAWVMLAVALWTAGLYALAAAIGRQLAEHLGLPPAVAVALPIVVLALAFPLLRALRQRRAARTPRTAAPT